jgi:4a-hydroxytetrahydrobiopterin dehydratase
MDLKDKKCVPSSTYAPPLPQEEKLRLQKLLGQDWDLTQGTRRIEKSFKFKNFKEALKFTNEVGRISEEENHHPEIHLGWGHCRIEIWTHTNDDLLENDFILAAKITEVYQRIFHS